MDIADLLALPDLGLRPVSVPRADAEVRWVATSELADPTPFLEGGELLLTTGLATAGWRSEWAAYVDRLAGAGVAGIGLGVGLTHDEAPPHLVAACEAAGLNLVAVPRATTFVAVSRAAARLLQRRDEEEARLALASQRELTAAALRPDPQPAVTQRLAVLLDGATCLLGPDGRELSGPHGQRTALLDLDATRAELARIRPQGLRAAATASDSTATRLLVPVGLQGRPVAYLAVSVPGRITEARRSAVATAVALLGLAAAQDRDRLESRRRLWRKVHELLTHGDVDAAALVAEAAGAPRLPPRVQVLRAAGSEEAREEALAELEADHLLAADVGDELWLVARPQQASRRAEQLAARDLRVGLGEVATRASVADSHATAARALERTSPARRLVRWDLLVREGAVGLLPPAIATAFSTSFLGVLDDDQVQTLAVFLRHHGSRLKVAADLGLHRNTVRNRIEAIEAALGRSLDDPDTRASAWLALQGRALSS